MVIIVKFFSMVAFIWVFDNRHSTSVEAVIVTVATFIVYNDMIKMFSFLFSLVAAQLLHT